MDDLVSEFISEAAEGLAELDLELVTLEKNPNDAAIIGGIFRIVHTIKGTCGFLGLPRLESIAHAAENVLGRFRDRELLVTPEAVTLILRTLDQIKEILSVIEQDGTEPAGDDTALIGALDVMAALKPSSQEAEIDGMVDLGAPASGASDMIDLSAPAADSSDGDDNDMIDLGAPAANTASSDDEIDLGAPAVDDSDMIDLGAPAQQAEAAPAPAPVTAKKPEAAAVASTTKPREISASAQNIRVSVNLLEDLMTMVSELVLTRNQLLQTMRNQESTEFSAPLQRLNHITSELQEGVMKTRMQPIGMAWNKLPRIVRDLAQELNKKIDLEMIGAETELDRQVLELIKDPLTHMVRNSCDHGLESSADRRANNKPEMGRITLHALHEGGHIVIRITDDGKGLPVDIITRKILEKGMATEAELADMSKQEVLQFIFKPGFSTADAVTNVSGRGVGMDVVRTNIERIGGAIELESEEGVGTTVSIKIPLTLAIVAALIVEAGGERFAIPQISVLELVRTSAHSEHRIEYIDQTPVLRLRDRLLPLVNLGGLLNLKSDTLVDSTDCFIIVAQVGQNTFGIVVDQVFDTEEIVVKPVAPLLKDIGVFSGNTILGDGSVVMILDPNGLAAEIGAARSTENQKSRADQAKTDHSQIEIVSLLVFTAGNGTRKAAPLSLVSRLEEMSTENIETADGRMLMHYRERLMPLLPVSDTFDLADKGKRPVIVFNDGPRWAGLIVDEIVDIIEVPLTTEIKGDTPGILGTMIVDGRSTELIDTAYYLTRIHADWFSSVDVDKKKQNEILVIDDSPFFRHLLSPLLQQAGYAVTSVESAEHAIELKESGAVFDLIVSDIEMPGMDGFAFAEHVKASSEWSSIPLIALSGMTDNERIERGRQVGFLDYVGKTDREALLNTLQETLRSVGDSA